MKLEMTIVTGPETKQFLMDLTAAVDRLERLITPLTTEKVEKVEAPAPEAEEDDEFAKPAKKSKAKAKSFDEDEEEEKDIEEAEEEEDFTAPAKRGRKAKAKKVTLDDVNDACREKAKATSRKAVLEILEENFGSRSISALSEDQWAECIELMRA